MARPDAVVLALDQGTTGSTALVFGPRRRGPRPRLRRDHAALPAAGLGGARRRGDLADEPARDGRRRSPPRASRRGRSRAIGITNQRETTVLWDRATGNPVHRAIVWQSRQTRRHLRAPARRAATSRSSASAPACVLDAYFSGTQDRWLLESDAGAPRARRGRRARLRHDRHLAALPAHRRPRTRHRPHERLAHAAVYDIHERRWDAELLAILGVPAAVLPEVRPSAGVFGETVAHDGVPAGLPIAGVAGDQQAALFGQGCFEPGMAKNTYGTGCFLVMNTGDAPRDQPPRPARRRSAATPAAAPPTPSRARSSWPARRSSGCATSSASCARPRRRAPLAESVADTAGVYVVPAFAGLGAPLLGHRRARRRARPDARRGPRAPRARHAREPRLPDPRRDRGDERRLRRDRCASCASTAAPAPTTS